MIILQENEKLEELAWVTDPRIVPDELYARRGRFDDDGWAWTKSGETKETVTQLGLHLGIGGADNGFDVDFGFVRNPYPYRKGVSGKASGAKEKDVWVFCAIQLSSTVPNAKGRWSSINFKDSEFEFIWNKINTESRKVHSDDLPEMVKDIIRDLKLKPNPSGNILNLCSDFRKNLTR